MTKKEHRETLVRLIDNELNRPFGVHDEPLPPLSVGSTIAIFIVALIITGYIFFSR